MNQTFSLYTKGNSFVHRISPLAKLLFVFLMFVIAYSTKNLLFLSSLFLFLLILLALAKCLRRSLSFFMVSALTLLMVFVVQSLFFKGNESHLFSILSLKFYSEGMIHAGKICLRVLILVSSFSLLVFTIDPEELTMLLVKKGFSARLAYVILSVFQIIPEMMKTIQTITDAQKSRALKTTGSLFQRIKSFFPLIVPVVINSLIMSRERSMALEMRAFSRVGKPTFVREEKKYLAEKSLPILLWLILFFYLIWRFVQWL
ncbi:MAG: energy-coupling factor transporter transmembrane component T family protein [Lactovum sp.]